MRLPREFTDFYVVQKQLSWPFGVVIHPICFEIFRDIASNQPDFTVPNASVRFVQRDATVASCLFVGNVARFGGRGGAIEVFELPPKDAKPLGPLTVTSSCFLN